MTNEQKAERLADLEGFSTVEEMLNDMMFGLGNHGICTNEGCDYCTSTEPDSTTGWCEECETNTVASGLALMGIY
jgi:hypothetical protein